MISELTNHLWQSTLFAIVAGLLAVVLRKNRAEVRYWLWFSASLKFFIPFSLLINLGSHLDSVPAAHKVTQIATQIATPSVSKPSRTVSPKAAITPLLSTSSSSRTALRFASRTPISCCAVRRCTR